MMTPVREKPFSPWSVSPVSPSPVDPDTPRAPPTLGELFRACSSVGLSGFGVVLPLLRHMLVDERRLMDGKDFNALLGLCQFLPGSNVVNLAVWPLAPSKWRAR